MRSWQSLKEHWRFKYGPPVVDYLVDLSTAKAKRKLKKTTMNVLVDNSVLSCGITHETAQISTGTKKWGNIDVDTGYVARVSVHSLKSESRELTHLKYLPGLVSLAKNGHLKLFTSAELADEQFRQPMGRYSGYGSFDYNIFSRVKIESVDGHTFPTLGPSYLNLKSPLEQQRERLKSRIENDDLFRALVNQLGPNNTQDAWHIRTAEFHQLFCFLTMDFKLRKNVEVNGRREPLRSLITKVMTPLELGTFLGLIPVHPVVFSYHNANWFVRGDLHMPDSKRRPGNLYRKTKNDSRNGM